jgi:hypothetical protein
MGNRRDSYRSWWEELSARDYLRDLRVYVRIVLEWIYRKWYGEAWTRLILLRIGTIEGLL